MRGPIHCLVNVRVVEDDGGALAAELERHLLQVRLGRRLHDLAADRRTAGERNLVVAPVSLLSAAILRSRSTNLLDMRVLRNSLTDDTAVAVDEVEDTSGEAGLVNELGHEEGGEGGELGGLEDDRAAGRECGADLPRHHLH